MWHTWRHKCAGEGVSLTVAGHFQREIDAAIWHHITTNPHHPEYWDSEYQQHPGIISNRKARVIDATGMDDVSLAEMTCDWHAMSLEASTRTHDWADSYIGKRCKFTKQQCTKISMWLDTLDSQDVF